MPVGLITVQVANSEWTQTEFHQSKHAWSNGASGKSCTQLFIEKNVIYECVFAWIKNSNCGVLWEQVRIHFLKCWVEIEFEDFDSTLQKLNSNLLPQQPHSSNFIHTITQKFHFSPWIIEYRISHWHNSIRYNSIDIPKLIGQIIRNCAVFGALHKMLPLSMKDCQPHNTRIYSPGAETR